MFNDRAVKVYCYFYIVYINHLQILCGSKFNQIGIITEIYLNFALLLNDKIMKKHIPNFITSLNLAAGFIAVIFSFNGYLVTGSWLILLAMIFDFLDGFSARLLNSYSEIGKELDSLADVVSFGVAPAIIIYQLLGTSMSLPGPLLINAGNFITVLILLLPVFMPVCAALRQSCAGQRSARGANRHWQSRICTKPKNVRRGGRPRRTSLMHIYWDRLTRD